MRVSAVGLAPVTRKTLPIVRKLTDDLIAADPRAKQLVAAGAGGTWWPAGVALPLYLRGR